MKLKQMKLDHRVLKELEIQFERGVDREAIPIQKGYALDFLVGVNGTGKSTVLRAIAVLFHHLLLGRGNQSLPFQIELAYQITPPGEDLVEVIIATDEAKGGRLRYKVGGPNTEWLERDLDKKYWPDYVVAYTTGNEEAWQTIFDPALLEPDEDVGILSDSLAQTSPPAEAVPRDGDDIAASFRPYIHEQPGHKWSEESASEQEWLFPDRRFLFLSRERLGLVALGGLLAHHWPQEQKQGRPLEPVLREMGIKELALCSLRVRLVQRTTPPAQWEVFEKLRQVADRIVQQGADQLLLFDIEAQKNRDLSIFTLYNSPIQLFQRLYMLYDHAPYDLPPLQAVHLFFKMKHPEEQRESATQESQEEEAQSEAKPMLHRFDWLSDGEQSFLARMALFALFREDNLLILLDEPEVHFNDVWKRQIVYILDQIMTGKDSHALITTHSSIALSDVQPEDILILRRQGSHTSGVVGERQHMQTFGADPSDILVHVFGTPAASGEFSRQRIAERIEKASTVQQLEALQKIVAPGYWRYRLEIRKRELGGREASK